MKHERDQPAHVTCDPKGVLDQLSPNVMYKAIATKLMLLMDRLTVDQLRGKAPITDADLFGG